MSRKGHNVLTFGVPLVTDCLPYLHKKCQIAYIHYTTIQTELWVYVAICFLNYDNDTDVHTYRQTAKH